MRIRARRGKPEIALAGIAIVSEYLKNVSKGGRGVVGAAMDERVDR